MSPVSSITPHIRRLEAPADLRELQGWLMWRHEQFPGEAKPRKVPYYAAGAKRHGTQGSPDDRAKLVTFAAARDAAARGGFDGVGLALMPEFGVTALDFDNVVDASGNLPDEVDEIVNRTYAEYSPSGQGVRAFVRGVLGNHKSFKGEGVPYTFETFSSKGFVTFTGNPLFSTELLGLEDTIAPVNECVIDLCHRRFGERKAPEADDEDDAFTRSMNEQPLGLTEDEIVGLLGQLDASMGREDWIRVGMAVHHETGGDGFDLWDDWSSDGHQYPGTEALKAQWASFERRDSSRKPVTMATVKKMVKDAGGNTIAAAAEAARASSAERVHDPNEVRSSEGWTGKYHVWAADEYAERDASEWIVKGVLPKAELAVLYGASGSGKSFVGVDMCLAIARGVPWRDCKVNQARVLYIAAEGSGGVAHRLKAYRMHNDVSLSGIPFGVISDAPNLMVEEDASALVAAIIDAGGADILVLDTWAQVTPGADENSGADMGMALRHAKEIRKETGAMILLVAHVGKDAAKGIRGWSGLNAAADTSLEVSKPEEGTVRTLRVTKQKDGRDDLEWGFTLDSVVIGLDSDGDEITSMVVTPTEAPAPQSKDEKGSPARKFGVWERVVLDYIATLEPDVGGMETEALIKAAVATVAPPEEGHRDLRSKNIRRAMTTLIKGKDAPLSISNGFVDFMIA